MPLWRGCGAWRRPHCCSYLHRLVMVQGCAIPQSNDASCGTSRDASCLSRPLKMSIGVSQCSFVCMCVALCECLTTTECTLDGDLPMDFWLNLVIMSLPKSGLAIEAMGCGIAHQEDQQKKK